MLKEQVYKVLWSSSVITTVLGVIAFAAGQALFGISLIAIGGSGLTLSVIWTEIQLALTDREDSIRQLVLLYSEAALFIIAVGFSTNVIPSEAPTSVRIVTLVLGVQAIGLTIQSNPATISRTAQWTILAAGHGTVLVGSVLALPFGPTNPSGALLLYAVGIPVVLLHAFWIRTYRSTADSVPQTGTQRWEGVLLIAIILGVPSALYVSLIGPEAALGLNSTVGSVATATVGITTTLAFATLGAPQSTPRVTQLLERHLVAASLHILVTLILVNTAVFAVFLIVPQLFIWILAGILVLLLIGVNINYSMIVHEQRSSNPDDEAEMLMPQSPISTVTVVITAFDEASVLSETLQQNLDSIEQSPFVLVPAARSTDGTIELMEEAQEAHSNRVRIVKGTSGSKAGDLNRVWQYIETPYVIVLDADETIDIEFVRRGLTQVERHPSVGIVQGRKVSTRPAYDAFRRFVTIERQHSTLLDHSLIDDIFDAGHFAGSSAIFRREVPIDVMGFDPSYLTEDIELTIRLYLQTDWNVMYNTQMIAREISPQDWDALFRQRERWARGWAQVAIQYSGDILRSWKHIGGKKAGALSWLLFTAVSAPIFTILPALSLHWYLGLAPQTSPTVALVIALMLLPERGISFVYTAIRDPVVNTSAGRVVEVLLFAYTWILFTWLVQLHSLYLQLSGTENVWHRTTKGMTGSERV
jgi:cellulose synthase/poly-beta-1,6-N-acetylglucosamine synthase-like glycosyltransferase